AINAQGKVRSSSAARDHAIGAAFRSNLKQQLAEVRTEQLVVGTDIGGALAVGSVRVEGDDGDTGINGAVDNGGGSGDIRHRDGQAINTLGDQIFDDLGLGGRFVFHGANVQAGHVAEFGGASLATVAGQVEERVVHRLGNN